MNHLATAAAIPWLALTPWIPGNPIPPEATTIAALTLAAALLYNPHKKLNGEDATKFQKMLDHPAPQGEITLKEIKKLFSKEP